MTGKKSSDEYIGQRQATVAQWVDLLPLLEVCTRETGYKGGGLKQRPWWRQQTTKETLCNMLEESDQEGQPGHREGGKAEASDIGKGVKGGRRRTIGERAMSR